MSGCIRPHNFVFCFSLLFYISDAFGKIPKTNNMRRGRRNANQKEVNKNLSFSHLHFSTEICNLLGNFQEKKKKKPQKKNTYISVSFVDSLSHSIMVSLITLSHTHRSMA